MNIIVTSQDSKLKDIEFDQQTVSEALSSITKDLSLLSQLSERMNFAEKNITENFVVTEVVSTLQGKIQHLEENLKSSSFHLKTSNQTSVLQKGLNGKFLLY